MKRLLLILIVLVGVSAKGEAQKAERSGFFLHNRLYRANKEFSRSHYIESANKYERLYEKGKLDNTEKGDYAEVLLVLHQSTKSEAVLDSISPRSMHQNKLLIQAALDNGHYDKAEKLMKLYPEFSFSDISKLNGLSLESYLKSIHYYKKYQISEVGFNTEKSEFSPFQIDDKLYFTSDRGAKYLLKGGDKLNGSSYLSVYYSEGIGEVYKDGKLVNDGYHSGPICFNTKGNVLFVVQNSYKSSNFGNKKEDVNTQIICMSTKDLSGHWSELSPLPISSEKYSCGHPFLAPDDKTLYFTSDMPGGYGATDLYYMTVDEGVFGEPVNMGPDINTTMNDMFPFVDDQGHFYFASNGYVGFGGLDLMIATKYGSGYKVENMGAPINSRDDDFSIFMIGSEEGYFASNREGGSGADDIYRFENVENDDIQVKVVDKLTRDCLSMVNVVVGNPQRTVLARGVSDEDGIFNFELAEEQDSFLFYIPDHADYAQHISKDISGRQLYILELERKTETVQGLGIYGYVYDNITGVKVENAHLHFVYDNIEEHEIFANIGEYLQPLEADRFYRVVVTKSGYFPYEFDVNTSTFSSWKAYNIPLSGMIELKDIYYLFDKWNITPSAKNELNKLVGYLQRYPDVRVRLESHTDARGSHAYNQELSNKRGLSAKDYLVEQGVDSSRIIVKGWGEEKLVNKCVNGVECTPMEHQANRRTEIHILKD